MADEPFFGSFDIIDEEQVDASNLLNESPMNRSHIQLGLKFQKSNDSFRSGEFEELNDQKIL